MITKSTIDSIILSSKIEEVVGDFVNLKRRGQNLVGLCPFHDDKNPSMYVSARLGIFKCFVCDKAGDSVKFLMEHEKISYPEALKLLAKKYGIPIEEEKEKSEEEIAEENERESMFLLNAFAEHYFENQLWNSEEGRTIGLSYLRERGFTDEIIKKFKIGYNPDSRDNFTAYALKKGYSESFLIQTGLTKQNDKGKLFDFYHGRIIFPIYNAIGKTVGFGARTLQKDSKISKYFNSPENEIYHKSDILYGFFQAKKEIRAKDNVFLVEGYTDVISLVQSGVANVVASSGTALTGQQVKLIASQTKNITVLYDGDSAGIKASMRGVDMLVEAGLNVKVVLLPDNEDPDSFVKKHRSEEIIQFLKDNSIDFLVFKIKILSQEAGNDTMKRASMINDVINTISEIKDPIAQTLYVKESSNLLNIEETVINAQLRKLLWKKLNKNKEENDISDKSLEIISSTSDNGLPKNDPLVEIEKNIIEFLLNYGQYEIVIEKTVDGKPIFSTTRVDQYIYDEINNDNLSFSVALHKKIFGYYAEIAEIAETQLDIQNKFKLATHKDQEVQNFVVSLLLKEKPQISEKWEEKFEVFVDTVDSDIKKLQTATFSHITFFKLRILEKYIEILKSELNEKYSEKDMENIFHKLILALKIRKKIAKELGIVVTK